MKQTTTWMLVLLFLSMVTATVETNKQSYMLGEVATIRTDTTDLTDPWIKLTTPSKIYTYFDPADAFRFIPQIHGTHTLSLYDADDLISTSEFIIERDVPTLRPIDNVRIGEKVIIQIDDATPETSLRIDTGSNTYTYLGGVESQVIFYAKDAGTYIARLYLGNEEIQSIQFRIWAMPGEFITEPMDGLPERPTPPETEEKIYTRALTFEDSQNRTYFMQANVKSIDNETEELTLRPELARIATVRFKGLKKGNFDLKLESIDEPDFGFDARNAFAIDPSKMDFEEGEIIRTAESSQLLKCAEWDFENQQCNGAWKKVADLVPGENYTILFDSVDPAYAEVGVSTINTKKSVYRPGETAELIAVILDTVGFLADANLTVSIMDPVNQTSLYTNPSNITRIEKGIYELSFPAETIGSHTVIIQALGEDVNTTMITFFEVLENFPFDVIRDSPVTIDPWQGAYETTLEVISINHTGLFNLTEVVPVDVTIFEPGGAAVTVMNSSTLLTWYGLTNGTVVSYLAQAPLISPNVLELGPVLVTYGDKFFEEGRPWYLAVDPLAEPGGEEELRAQDCEEQNSQATENNFPDSCDGSYPAACTTDRLSCDEGTSETATSIRTTGKGGYSGYGGVKITTFNTAITDCTGITSVELCYEFWGAGSGHNCVVGVDNDGDDSFVESGATCSATAPGVNCIDVTGDEGWTCSNFFGASGTRATAKAQAQRTSGTGTQGWTFDVLYFSVDYTIPADNDPVVTLNEPDDPFIYDTTPSTTVTFNCSATDDNSVENISLYMTDSTNLSFSYNDSCTIGATSGSCSWNKNLYIGNYTWNCLAIDSADQTDWGSNRTVILNYTITPGVDNDPTASLQSPVDSYNASATSVDFSCLVADDYDLTAVSIYTNISGTWELNQTIDIDGPANTSYTASFTVQNIGNQTSFVWNCRAEDNATSTQYGWDGANRSATILERPEPFVTLSTPADASTQSDDEIDFTCSAVDDYDIASLSLYANKTGSFSLQGVQVFGGTSDTSVSHTFTDISSFADGSGFVWSCRAIDNESISRFAYQNFSFDVEVGEPNVTLVSPVTEYVDLDGDVTLTCLVEDNIDITEVNLFTNLSGTWALNQTTSFGGGSDVSESVDFDIEGIPYGTRFVWSCNATDSDGNSRFAPSNYSLKVADFYNFYGTQAQGGWTDASNAQEYPDNSFAIQQLDDENILSMDSITGVPTEGTLLSTYLTLAWYASQAGVNDQLDLGYSLSDYDAANLNLDGTTYDGTTSASSYPLGSVDNQSYEITGTLATSDLDDIRLRIQGDQVTSPDNTIAYIDSLYLSIQFDFLPMPYAWSKSISVVFSNTSVDFFTTWMDDYYLGCFIFSINQTGTWKNSSCIDFTDGSYDEQSNYTYFINATPGSTVQWRFYANDSRSQLNSTPLQEFTVANADDNVPPSISNEQVQPTEDVSGSVFNISAIITDDFSVQTGLVEITDPSGTTTNYTMTQSQTLWYYLYTGHMGGNYSVSIIAIDGVNNTNRSASRPVFNVTSQIFVPYEYYQRGDRVPITGKGYSPSSTANLTITSETGSTLLSQPVLTNATGGFLYPWTIPADLDNYLDNYTIEANDTQVAWLTDSANVVSVVKSDASFKYDDNAPAGVSVFTPLNFSDDINTTIVSDATQAYIDTSFEDLILDGYTLDELILYVEHIDFDADSDPIVVQYYDGATYQTATCGSIAFSAAETFGTCDLTADIGSLPDANDIDIRLTDNNANAEGSDFTQIDFVYLDMNFSITNTLSVDILEPTDVVTTLDFSDAINNDAFEGTTGTNPGGQATGTEASSSDYEDIDDSDDARWQTVNTIQNDFVYQSFYFYTTQDESDIVDMDVTWEGYITSDGTTAEDINIYAWNYETTVYDDLYGGQITGTTVDQEITLDFGTDSDYIDTDGEVNVIVMSFEKRTGGEIRQDLFTDYIKLDIASVRTITGFQDVNVSAVDADGVTGCNITYYNSSDLVEQQYVTTQISSYRFYNRTYTPDLPDGLYNLTATCTDGTEVAEDSLNVRISNDGPNVTLVYPPSGSLFTVNDINFTWNATQDSGVPVCDIYIDGMENVSNVNANNGANTTRQVDNIDDGFHTWSVICANGAGVEGTSQTWNFTIDTGAPTINLDDPGDGDISASENITFLYTPTDSSAMNCSLFIDDTLEQENTSVSPNQQTSFYVTEIVEGAHNWTVYCTDSFDFTGTSSTYDFTVDTTDPSILLTFPEPGDIFLGGLVQFNYTAFDNLDTSLTCDIVINNIIEFNDVVSSNGTPVIQSKELTSGIKYWNVTCTDDASRTNTSITQNFTVNGNPTVNLVSPANVTSYDVNNISLIYFAEDTDDIQNCSLYVDGALNQTNTTIFSGQNNNFTLDPIDEDYYNWYVQCFDNTTQSSTSGTYQFTIDRTTPNITLVAPAPDAFFETGDLSFNFTVTDNLDDSLECYLYIDGSVRTGANGGFFAQNGTLQVRNETGILGGDHFWDVSCIDDSGLEYLSESRDFTIGGLPTVDLQQPQNNTFSMGNVTFIYYVQDDDGINFCSLYIKGVFNQTNSTPANGANNSFFLSDLSEQDLNWSVLCEDGLNLNNSDGEFTVTIDNTAPAIILDYPDGQTLTSDTVEFNFTIVENTQSALTCDLFVNNTLWNDDFSASNGTNSVTNSSLPAGTSFWNVTCWDEAFNYGYSDTNNFTISLAPDVTLLAPPDESTDTDGEVYFQFRVNNNDINNCTVYINDQPNSTIYSGDIVPFGTSEINVNFSHEQRLNWTVGCINDQGTAANASNGPWWLNIDFTPPQVNLSEPVPGANISLSTITYNFTAYDNIDTSLACNISVSGRSDITGITATNGTPTTQSDSGYTPGTYFWNVTCNDGGFTDTSETWNFTVSQDPTVELISPEPDYSDLDGDLSFIYKPSTINASGFLACRLYIDEGLNQTNASLTAADNGIELRFTALAVSQGYHNWSINCTDFGGYDAVSETRDFIVDLTDPTVDLTYPDDHILNSSFSFNFTADDNIAPTLSCDLNNNGSIISGISATAGDSTTEPISGLVDGLFYWNVTCYDDALRSNTSLTYNYTVAEVPTVTLGLPAGNHRSRNTTFNFTYTPEDNSGSLASCTIFVNEQQNQTNNSIVEGIQNNFTISNFQDGSYDWTIQCTDPSGNAANATVQTFVVDLTGPTIDLIFPEEGDIFNIDDLNFTFNATDLYGTDNACDIYIDGQPNVSGLSATSGSLTNRTIYDLAQGPHNWSVACIDDLGNAGSSIVVNFTVNSPDLTLNASDIAFNNSNPDENETIRINATIYNIGGVQALDVPIEFWEGIPGIGTRINGIQTIASIDPGQQTDVFVDWNISLGMHQIYVLINYTGVELNYSNNNASRNVSVLYPTIDSPPNETWTVLNDVQYFFTLRDYTGGLINYSFYDAGTPIQSGNATDLVQRDDNITFAEGRHTVFLRATDYLSREKDTGTYILYVDQTPPDPNFETQDGWFFNDQTPEISFNVTDQLDAILNYSLFVDGALENESLIPNATSTQLNLTTLTDGIYTLTLNATDNALNENSTNITIYIDTVEPTINLEHPDPAENFLTTTVDLNYTVTDNLDDAPACNVTLDASTYRSSINSPNNTVINTTASSLSEGLHYWNVTCWDGGITTNINNQNTSDTRSFSVFIPPSISLIRPDDANWSNVENVSFFYNVTDDTGLENCSILINDIVNDTHVPTNGLINNFTVENMDGIYNWSIQCFDNTTQYVYARSENRTIYVDIYDPVPTFETEDDTWFNIAEPSIWFNITDNLDLNLDYILAAGGIPNAAGTVSNGSSSQATLTGLANGTYVLDLEATDDAYNTNNASQITIHIDTVEPTITLIRPEDNNITYDQNIFFNYTAYDNLASTLDCSLTVDSTDYANFTTYNNTYNSTTIFFDPGIHYWNVTCTDYAGNANTSETRMFNIPLPDLAVNASEIYFNASTFRQNTNITINATIRNIGSTDAENVVIQFFEGNYSLGNQIGSNFTVNLTTGGSVVVNTTWVISSIGLIDIYVVVDPPIPTGGSISEANETNNYAFKTIEVGSYNLVYGNLTGLKNIQDLTSQTIYAWNVSSYNGTLIYATDADSDVAWDRLRALSRDTADALQFDDFSELDIALFMENNTDSINTTWTLNNAPRETDTYAVFLNDIINVPKANSTNTTNFKTGILWDTSDGGSEYSGSQDVVFITEVNFAQQGKLGIYDYELKVPANLRLYQGPDTARVALYTEIR